MLIYKTYYEQTKKKVHQIQSWNTLDQIFN